MSRKLPRQARRELFWAVLGFALIQLGLAIVVVGRLPQVRDAEFAGKLDRLRDRLRVAPDQRLALVLGSSRMKMGLDAGRLSHEGSGWLTFNLGLEGCGPMMHRVCLRRLRAAGIRPNLVVAEVVPVQLLAGDRCPIEDRWLRGSRFGCGEIALVYRDSSQPWRLLSRWLQGEMLPCSCYQHELHGWLGLDRQRGADPDAGDCSDAYGWQPITEEPTPQRVAAAVGKALDEYREDARDCRFAPAKVRALRDLLDDCRRAGYPTALLLMPESTPFRDLYASRLDRDLSVLLEDLRRAFGLLAVIDARTWVADDGFVDAHHLHAAGARIFTERFGQVILPPPAQTP